MKLQVDAYCYELEDRLRDIIKSRIEEALSNLDLSDRKGQQSSNDIGNKGRRIKVISRQNRGSAKEDQPVTSQQTADAATSTNNLSTRERDKKNTIPSANQRRRNIKEKPDLANNTRPLPIPTSRGDDSTTQAADPSSEDKVEGEEGQDRDRVRRVFRRRKQHFNKRRSYNDRRRRRNDSSERNSNDTSPQNETLSVDYRSTTNKSSSSMSRRDNKHSNNAARKSFPELSESEISEIVQVLKRDFFTPELEAVKKTIDAKGPAVAQEFASSILDHAICDVTSSTRLSEIATNLYQLIISERGGPEFQQGFYNALSTISNREEDIAIDAPRYMDTLGQVLGECVVPMNNSRHRQLLKKFLTKCLNSYCRVSRAQLLASTMRGIVRNKEERFAKDIWDIAHLKWSNFLPDGTDLDQFVESEDVKFTTQSFSPMPKSPKKTPEELEKFADDVTNLVEKRCTPQTLEEMVRDLELESDEVVAYLGTLIYAIVRGCLTTDSGEYKLDTEALNKYSSILNGKSQIPLLSSSMSSLDDDGTKALPNKKETADAVALNALTALTKLWHQYNCPQNLMSTILLNLHSHGAASYDALKTWLNSEDLKNIPGIGAARLNSKRCIEDLGASRG